MTEIEAKTKWCPMSGKSNVIGRGFNEVGSLCIGSACMMWRIDMPDELRKARVRDSHLDDKHEWGYCGLAGKP